MSDECYSHLSLGILSRIFSQSSLYESMLIPSLLHLTFPDFYLGQELKMLNFPCFLSIKGCVKISLNQLREILMLKLIYTETDLQMELLTADLEDWVDQRLLFSNTTGEIIFLSSERASFLLPETICKTTLVNFYLHHQGVKTVTAERCDLGQVEIGLSGYWLSTDPDSDQGIFVTQLADRVEFYLWQLWCSRNSQSVMSDTIFN
jgi:hypothetical protein